MICDRCFQSLAEGAHGEGVCPYEPRKQAHTVVQDSVIGGFWAENGFDQPTYFESKKAHIDALAARGLEIRAKWAGEHDKHLKRWDTVDLDAAAQLVQRGTQAARAKNEKAQLYAEFPITVTDISFERPA